MGYRTQVLVVGGSLNGLSTALFLSRQAIRCTVVERHPATTVQYKFAGISPRSMEIYRAAGIQDEIRANRTGDQKSGAIARARNLSHPEVQFLEQPWADSSGISMASAETCDQDRLEPILRKHAERHGADCRFNCEMVDFEQDGGGVRARVRNVETDAEASISADYLVAADGVTGETRQKLGIGRHGAGVLQHWMNLIFDTDLKPYLKERRITTCFVTDVNGSIVPRKDRWLLAVQYEPEKGQRPEDFDQARTVRLVRRAAGREDVEVRLFDARAWDVAACTAERFREGKAFLVGDAAHSMPPTGGFGGNTGIHDAHNLAWKLAFVLKRRADPALLDTYNEERHPVAERTQAQALSRLSAWFKDPTKRLPPPEPIVDDMAIIFGAVYPRGALVGEPTAAAFEDPRCPSGRPGSRAPHFLVEREEGPTGIHDLLGDRFVLLAGSKGKAWSGAAAEVARESGLDLPCLVGPRGGNGESGFEAAYGVDADGAVLIRPDGYIAWRSRAADADPRGVLREVLARLCIKL